jgi:hypothetical protein
MTKATDIWNPLIRPKADWQLEVSGWHLLWQRDFPVVDDDEAGFVFVVAGDLDKEEREDNLHCHYLTIGGGSGGNVHRGHCKQDNRWI